MEIRSGFEHLHKIRVAVLRVVVQYKFIQFQPVDVASPNYNKIILKRGPPPPSRLLFSNLYDNLGITIIQSFAFIVGVIRTVVTLDYEQMSELEFHVRVSDLGKPKLTSETLARVRISVIDVNDCPPVFSQSEYNATVIVPTYNNIAVVQVGLRGIR